MSDRIVPTGHAFRPIVVAPTFNHVATLLQVMRKIEAVDLPMIIVNDGCTDATALLLTDLLQQPWRVAVHVVMHDRNQGKAAAMKSGFDEAHRLGFTHAITVDTDGQHEPGDIPAMLAVAAAQPLALVLGERSEHLPGYPIGSLWGRRLSNLMIYVNSGLRISDSQCGLRVYPLALIRHVQCKAKRYAFESEIITRAVWAGWPVRVVPVTSFYAPKFERISHFRTWRDTTRGVLLQARLLSRALVPWPHRRSCPKDLNTEPNSAPSPNNLRQYLRSMTPSRLWAQARQDAASRVSLAAALAVGVFIANLPVYPFQTAAALYLAARLHLQPLAVVAGSLLSTPPIGPLLIALAIMVGHLLLHAGLPELSQFHVTNLPDALELIKRLLVEWMLGSVVVGLTMMAATFTIAWAALSRIPLREPQASDESKPSTSSEPNQQQSSEVVERKLNKNLTSLL